MLSAKIKEATKTPHQEVEKKVVAKIKTIRNEADYADLLKHFYAYFNAVEQVIAPYITTAVLPDLAERRNASYIRADIEALGGTVDELPFATAPEVNNTVQALGALYVLEGSIMGGPYIVKMLQKGGLTKGFSFFSGYGEASGQKWGEFTAVLDALAKNEEDEKQALQAAHETFARFGDVFGTVNHPKVTTL
ncbi:biliverdin-producing heme oxygenase [Pedobacter sp. MC2016-14]|uniref:biliverdin-producing heme oxygenase n=1 Tax=Pedobacter sp. MC2016-14 TaxID=2897327 RepID=UPI001E29A1B6|nr:biliverdin-producing heme oxygenase [Pedobacter sp. MC2016-14]MCD0490510.1 biliverdin-producing heme oxygenase [Pedobacter sp. MC2016-14]